MRILAAIVGVLALFALFVAGAGFILIGFADQNAADHVYVVKFARPGDDCGPEELALDVKDGHTLACTVGIPYEEPHVDLPGFTDEQNAAVQSLAAELGVGGLSEPEQRRIQAEVDRYAAAVPPEQRPYPKEATLSLGWFWGERLGWLGVGMVAIPVIASIVVMRRD